MSPISTSSIHNKPFEKVVMLSADRGQPSPQPTHLGIPASPHTPRVLHEPGSGYVAEKFEGKEQQMEEYVL